MEKKINIMVACLHTIWKTGLFFTISFIIIQLLFNDIATDKFNSRDIPLFIVIGGFVFWGSLLVYVFGILLPMYFIDKKRILSTTFVESVKRLLPISSLLSLPAIALWISICFSSPHNEEYFFVIYFINISLIIQIGLIIFLNQISKQKNE